MPDDAQQKSSVVPLVGVARATGGTCDWGYCDNYATALRYDPDTEQHLPVCDECKDKP